MSTRVFRIKEGDTRPPLFATLMDTDLREPVNLAGAEVKFIMVDEDGAVVVSQPAVVLNDGSTGGVRFDAWTAEITATAGRYLGEFEVTYPGGGIGSFPKEQSGFPILIVKDLG